MHLNETQITTFLISISVMLFSAKLLGEFFIKIKQPAIIGEILAGLILGPTVLGMLSPSTFDYLFPKNDEISIALQSFTTIAVVLLLLISGLEVDLAIVLSQGKKAIYTSNMGLFLPFLLGFGVSYLFPNLMGIGEGSSKFIFALFMGTALSISALPVIAKTLMDLKIFKLEIGVIIISAAMLNDLIGWLIFSIILGLIGTGKHGFTFIETIIAIIVFVVFVLTIGKKIIDKAIPYISSRFTFPGGILSFILILGFLGAAFTEHIGIHAIFGAFIIGIAIGDSTHLTEHTREIIHQFVTHIFAPLFFVSIGLKVNFIENFDFAIVSVILILSFFGKVIGCGLGAFWSGLNKNDSLIIGFGMNSRGTMEIILGIIALQAGLINEQVFVALVIMALVTSITSAPIMSYFLNKKDKSKFANLISEKNILFTDENDKLNIIKKLVDAISEKSKLTSEEIFNEVIFREKILPTGIANYLALPHAKINIKEPMLSIAINKKGIDFEASDGTLSRVIILLLTPKNNNELQLKLLSEIVNKFDNKTEVEKLLTIENAKTLIAELKK
ncbi:MAG: cation:proton antiporter [Ignavibacteriae bacterium]|nr:cation:proton antiporter [Ignavibacteriota bacterium]